MCSATIASTGYATTVATATPVGIRSTGPVPPQRTAPANGNGNGTGNGPLPIELFNKLRGGQ
ncbi:hypothetical protein GCM10022220_48600 [Actinocatenispora rupis]|uniref:Uncharacterized protein n=1 Tax=Actinocatenispora rupis TaxID=519421 RepID=A0A8J3J4K7_9ACTN|nr:hypothetical protein Aru02nite_49520 [Actinocatenispora rupis]